MARGGLRVRQLGMGLSAIAIGGAALGQENLPGADFFLDLRTGLLASDNFEALEDPSGTTTLWQTEAVLGIDSVTAADRFSARLGGTLEFGDYADNPDFNGGFTDPFLELDYLRENARSQFSLGVLWRERDNGFNDFTDATSGRDLIVDQGTRQDARIDLAFETGRDAPVGFGIAAFYEDITYFDTTDPDLTDQISYGVEASMRLAITSTADLTFGAAIEERDEDDPQDTFERNTSYAIGLAMQIDPALSARLEIGHAVNELTETINGDRVTDREEGPTVLFSLERALTNGTISVTAENRINSTGSQSFLRFGRAMELRNGSLEGSVGLTWTANDEVRGVGSLDWSEELRNGAIGVRFVQTVLTNDDNNDELDSLLAVNYRHDINALSGLQMSLSVGRSEELDPDGTDIERATAEIVYTRQVTEDWNFNAGYRHSLSRETGEDSIVENRYFANIGRRFSLRP